MKIVVIRGCGLVGCEVVAQLRRHRHEVVAADLETGVNACTHEGLDGAFKPAGGLRASVRSDGRVTDRPAVRSDRCETAAERPSS
jgi:nucleoside-diphosphate-sugar epimerase